MANVNCGSVRGYLTNKSTAFSPNGAKFGTQSMIHNHMMAHYKLIENAKSSIDNKPPKSMKKFIKVHSKRVHKQKESEHKAHKEELRRSQTNTPFERTNERLSYPKSSTSVGFHYDDDYDDRDFLDSQRQFRDLELQNERDNKLESFSRPRSAVPVSYKSSSDIPTKKSMTLRHKVEMYEPDMYPIEIKNSLFRSASNSNLKKKNNFENSPAMRSDKLPCKTNDNPRTSFVSSDMWSNGIVSYKQPNYMPSVRLDFSTMSLNEQLIHAQSVRKYENKTLPLYESRRLQKQEELIAEEQMYLQFLEEVTSDVLTRGIFSDRVLNQVFDVHIERRKGQLNEGRMRAMIEELKEDLNVKDSSTSVRQSTITRKNQLRATESASYLNDDINGGANAVKDISTDIMEKKTSNEKDDIARMNERDHNIPGKNENDKVNFRNTKSASIVEEDI